MKITSSDENTRLTTGRYGPEHDGAVEEGDMGILMDDQAVARRVLEHIENGTTDVAPEIWREPVRNYLSKDRLAAEIELVFRRAPTPFCPTAAMSEPGSYVAREAAGTPLLAVRGQDGEVRAFRNACRHRGMPLADGSGQARGFVCRYHGWTYGLDGRLRHVPHEHGFPGLDKVCHGLVPVAARERLGLAFITQDEPSLVDESLDEPPGSDPTRSTALRHERPRDRG